MKQTLLSDWTSIRAKVFVGRNASSSGEGYLTNYDMIIAVTKEGEEVTFSEINRRVQSRFGRVSDKSLKNVLNRAVKRGEFLKTRGRANRFRRSSST
ncbi:MAG TPA: hypothetical protein PKJ51_00495 [Methanothrix sp.]|nr:hypothetical protein [Methanothrix sp.]